MPYKKNYGYKKRYTSRRNYKRSTYKYSKPKYIKKFKKTNYDGAVYVKVFNVDPVYYVTTYGAYFITGWG